jgi:hypothetical protein
MERITTVGREGIRKLDIQAPRETAQAPLGRRLELLWGLWDYDVPGECFGYTPEEFDARKGELGFVGEIHRCGIPVAT